jgi:hypothetical protein
LIIAEDVDDDIAVSVVGALACTDPGGQSVMLASYVTNDH